MPKRTDLFSLEDACPSRLERAGGDGNAFPGGGSRELRPSIFTCPSPLEGEGGNANALPGGGSIGVRNLTASPPSLSSPSRGEGFFRAERIADRPESPVRIAEHIVIPESQYTISAPFEPLGAFRIADFIDRVLAPVDFDDQPRLGTEKIDDVSADRLLAAKAKSVELVASKPRPKSNFGIRWRLAQTSSGRQNHGLMFAFRASRHYPPPYPPPRGGRGIGRAARQAPHA